MVQRYTSVYINMNEVRASSFSLLSMMSTTGISAADMSARQKAARNKERTERD
jgi:hypothetical protein